MTAEDSQGPDADSVQSPVSELPPAEPPTPNPVPPNTSPVNAEIVSRQRSPLALVWLLLGLLALSSTAIFIKLSIQEISAEATVFNRLWIATLAFTSWNWFNSGQSEANHAETHREVQSSDAPTPEWSANTNTTESTQVANPSNPWLPAAVQTWPWETIYLLLALGLVHLTGRYLWTWSLTSTTAANGAMLANMPPLFTALGGWFLLGQRFDRRFLSGLAIAILGSITLVIGDWLQPKEALFGTGALLGDGAALLSSVFYAASFLLVEKLRQRLSTSDILVWRCAVGLVISMPLVWAIDDTIFPISTIGWIAVLGLALISEVMGHGLIVYSLKYFSSAFVTIVLLLEPAPVAAVAWIWFGEFLDPLNIAGFCLITLGIYLAKTGTGSAGSGGSPPESSEQAMVQGKLKELSGES